MREMNRLVLIGNEYDLAAGLKTSYEDFLIDYFKQCFEIVYETEEEYDDSILTIIKINPKPNKKVFADKLKKIDSLDKLLKSKLSVFDNPKSAHGISMETLFDVKLKSGFMARLLSSTSGLENWRDMENFYFNELLERYKQIESFPELPLSLRTEDSLQRYKQRVKRLNNEF